MALLGEELQRLIQSEKELEFEYELAQHPHELRLWLRYIELKKEAPVSVVYILYERALKLLPRSYKLWYAYLNLRKSRLRGRRIDHPSYQILANTYERALVHLNKMPRIWLDYLELLMTMRKGTHARRTFDRALQALPVTQHSRLWKLYIQWAKEFGVEETAIRVFRRYLMFDPAHREEYVDYLEEVGQFEEAARQLAICVNDDHFVSLAGHTKHQMWMRLCDMCAEHPQEVSAAMDVDAIIRSGISRFSDEVGRLWCRLADYYIRLGQFEKARDIYEEGINAVVTVRDFTMIFDGYAQFEESLLTAKMRMVENADAGSEDSDYEDEEDRENDADDVELRLARLEYLLDRRPILLNSVVLRQNPHNVHEWHKRAKLFENDPAEALKCYFEALEAVDPAKAVGKLSTLYIALGRFYEKHEDIESSRSIFERGTTIPYKSLEELANVWCNWAEMEMRQGNYQDALEVMQRAVTEPKISAEKRKARAKAEGKGQDFEQEAPVQERVYKSTKVWSLYLDLEESLGTVDTTRAAYERALELKIVTPQMVMNYAAFLEEHNYFEDAFKAFENGIALFEYPHVKPLWLAYLDKFTQRYEGTKLERLRDLFEQAIMNVPPKDAAELYLKYAKMEETYGLARHAMNIYDRATRIVPQDEKYDMFLLYAKKVESYFGITKTRPVYEKAIEVLPDEQAKKMCIQFSNVERKLGEIDRARAILQHGSQFADPRRDPQYWKHWNDFEVAHGNEDTFREMMRVKRSVENAFSQVNYMAAEMGQAVEAAAKPESDLEALAKRAEAEAAQRAAASGAQKRKFVAGGTVAAGQAEAVDEQAKKKQPVAAEAPRAEEIDIDDIEPEDFGLQERSVPLAVFGSAGEFYQQPGGAEGSEAPKKGALERLKGK